MSRIVFILGAGASAHCGTPTMDSFLEVARDLLRRGEVEEAAQDFRKVFDAVGKLQATQSKAQIDIYNIENVFAAFEMGKLLGSLPGIQGKSEIEKLIPSIKKVIGYTLEQTTKLPSEGDVNAPESYYEFAGVIESLNKENRDCSIITFNYDLGLDYSLYRRGILPDYGLNDIKLRGESITYLKLHGSLNWGRCSNCKEIVPYRQFQYTRHKVRTDYNTIPVISKLKKLTCRSCGEPLEEDPFIVPPTWNKTAYHEQIDEIWKRAAHELKNAENIFVLGYSFPSTDSFFQYLFALGVDVTTTLSGFYVYDINPAVEERFRSLLGSGIIQKFQYYNASFEDSIKKSPPLPNISLIRTVPQILNIR